MALVNHAKREINVKLVCCGAASSGKATLLKSVCSKLPADNRGPLKSMTIEQDKMLFFDFSHPEDGAAESYCVKFHLYTLTGHVAQENAWKLVLKGVDGVLFVADSDPSRQLANKAALDQIKSALYSYGKGFDNLPSVLVCSKQDAEGSMDAIQIAQGLSLPAIPIVPISATAGSGVLTALSELLEKVFFELEGLDLELHPAVHMLRNMALQEPELKPFESRQSSTVDSSRQAPTANLNMESGLSDEPNLLTSGAPVISPDGTVMVPLKMLCCGRERNITLTISLT
jgi:signal recognition particle receptor subunit beta